MRLFTLISSLGLALTLGHVAHTAPAIVNFPVPKDVLSTGVLSINTSAPEGTILDEATLHHRPLDYCNRINQQKHRSEDIHPLPLPLPDRFKGSLKCNPAPTGKYPDSHCGMVWFAIREFCDEFAYSFLRDRNNPRSNASVDLYNTPIVGWNGKEGPQRRFPEDDDYHIEIFEVPYCGDPRLLWEYEKYTSDKWCQAMLWGTWTSCNNKGRGGALTTGCLAYNFTTLQ